MTTYLDPVEHNHKVLNLLMSRVAAKPQNQAIRPDYFIVNLTLNAIAAETGIDSNHVLDAIRRLETLNLLKVTHHDPGQTWEAIYTVRLIP